MSEFLHYVLWQLRSSLALVVLVGIAVGAVLGAVYYLHKRKYKEEKKFPWANVLLWLVFIGYLTVVLYVTNFRSSLGHRQVNLYLFRAWREAWNNFSQHRWLNVLLNIAMFGPLGFLLPLLNRKFRKWYVMIPVGCLSSLAIELVQLAFASGVFDVDDLFCNTLGGAMGYFAVMAVLSVFREKGKRLKAFLYFVCLTMIPVVAIGSIFVTYNAKEYGNLPDAAAYRVGLEHLEWKLECDLSESEDTIPVYRSKSLSYEDCDAFAEEIADLVGQEVDIVSHYQEMAYYNLTRGILMVYYHGGAYAFMDYESDMLPGETDRETLENLLKEFSVFVPEKANFASEGDGWYSFTCHRQIDGDSMVDGTLRVRYCEDNSIREIENDLISYTYDSNASIISPMDAYKRLKNGEFTYAESLKHYSSESVTVISCELDYEIDTKGFNQPVYIFEILIPETENTCTAMIPAIQ